MSATRPLAVVRDPRFRGHRAPPGHPEHPGRLDAVEAALDAAGTALRKLEPREASEAEITRIHPPEYLEHLARAVAQAPAHLDPDTYVSPESLEVARLAAGSTVEAARAVAQGRARAAFAAVRPPGHHAEASRAMGFCLLNNVAVAARALQQDEGLERILIVDWDVHHGNGTQHAFESDPSVLYFSTHQYPHYPGTGAAGEIGVGAGTGATVNVPLPPGAGDAEVLGAFHRVLVPVAARFRPDLILVSCGFDAHERDPLASLCVTGTGYREMARLGRALAERWCEGRLVLVLEGGYAPEGLREGTGAVLDALQGPPPELPAKPPPLPSRGPLTHVLEAVARAHQHTHPEILIG